MARVFLRPRAERDLREISDYIAERSGDERAAAVLQRLARMMNTQAEYPNSGRRRDEIRPGLRSTPAGRYVIFYFPLEDGIDVVRVLYGGRNIEAIFEQEDDE